VIILKKTLAIVLLFFVSLLMPSQNCIAQQALDDLSNNALTSDRAIKDGNIVMIMYLDKISNITGNDMEIYNINNLDKFIQNTEKGIVGNIRVIKYASSENKTWVNSLCDLSYDGKSIKDIGYDVYSNPNKFISNEPYYSLKMLKRDYPNALW
jgi:hypothetical protein